MLPAKLSNERQVQCSSLDKKPEVILKLPLANQIFCIAAPDQLLGSLNISGFFFLTKKFTEWMKAMVFVQLHASSTKNQYKIIGTEIHAGLGKITKFTDEC
uniref:Uncharacterized protein n=1 Tax=Micrurus corallinus TaxID=54390 RepID=A0A2D4FSM2_MICCO